MVLSSTCAHQLYRNEKYFTHLQDPLEETSYIYNVPKYLKRQFPVEILSSDVFWACLTTCTNLEILKKMAKFQLSSQMDEWDPIPNTECMVYLPTFTIKNQVNVGKYTIHGLYGYVYRMIDTINERFSYTTRSLNPDRSLPSLLRKSPLMLKRQVTSKTKNNHYIYPVYIQAATLPLYFHP